MEENFSKNSSSGDLSQVELEINSLLSQDDSIQIIDKVPKLANLIYSVLERVKDIYQVYPAL